MHTAACDTTEDKSPISSPTTFAVEAKAYNSFMVLLHVTVGILSAAWLALLI